VLLASGLHNLEVFSKYEKKDKMVFSYLVWGGTRRYGGVGRKSLFSLFLSMEQSKKEEERYKQKKAQTLRMVIY